ncbi:MAG TPA: alpha-hydroxy acid oxidase [Vicinamibacterales bacterium]|nr:alpha-hydroxy acid oxidase [Vicinamibacterales bacterium]
MDADRRRLLQLIASSSLVPFLELPDGWADAAHASAQSSATPPDSELIASAAEALSVFDFEPVARAKLPPWHWAWLSTGGDGSETMQANREGFERYQIRARRLVDVSKVDTSVRLFNQSWETPIFLSPVGGHRTYNPDGELATARAAKSKRHLQVLSTVTTTSVEDVNAARGEPVWFQLYQRDEWGQTRQLIKRVESAGCPALVFTVDLLGGRNMEQFNRVSQRNRQQCGACHLNGQPLTDLRNRPMLNALSVSATPQPEIGTPTWDYVKRLKDATGMKLLVKGIVTREDAELAIQNGVDGVYISNHGGRAENSLRPTVQCISEVAAGVAGRAPILVDGGIRRGTDVYKALALGATAVGVGRPYMWGLASFGQPGVEAVLDILRREFQLIMRQSGVTSVRGIGATQIVDRQRS